jgi:hypothetical protein
MPKELDPAWEYYVPDSEIEELIAGSHKDPLKSGLTVEEQEATNFHKVKSRHNGRITVEVLHYLKHAYITGISYKEMIRKSGVCRRTIQSSLRLMGVYSTNHNREKRRKFRELWMKGVRYWEIETKLGVSEISMKRWRREMGLPLRRPIKEKPMAAQSKFEDVTYEQPRKVGWRDIGCKLSDAETFHERGEEDKEIYISRLFELARIVSAEIARLKQPAPELPPPVIEEPPLAIPEKVADMTHRGAGL